MTFNTLPKTNLALDYTPNISVINASTVVSDVDVAQWVNVVKTQIVFDFGPVWHKDANITFNTLLSPPPSGAWQVVIVDNADQATVLGYHDVTAEGKPLGRVFAGSALARGQEPSAILSSEVLSLLLDPFSNLTACHVNDFDQVIFYGLEATMPLAGDLYSIDNIAVSNFLCPDWFAPSPIPVLGNSFDHLNKLLSPLSILEGGASLIFCPGGGGWRRMGAKTTIDNVISDRPNKRMKHSSDFVFSTTS